MFFSKEQLEVSIKHLGKLDPFFGMVFLALKEINLPEGETKQLKFQSLLEAFLQKYYRPTKSDNDFYTPFKASHKKRWMTLQYAKTLQRMTVTTFSDVIRHPKGSSEWGWKTNYVQILSQEHLTINLIPTFDLAVWLFRSRKWDRIPQHEEIIETFFSAFRIDPKEQILFNTTPPSPITPLFQEHPVDSETLVKIIGLPPSEEAKQRQSPLQSSFSHIQMLAEYGAKLQMLQLTEVGPSEEIALELAPRLNIITGDNALGKTFLLECAWWALTSTWASQYPAQPHRVESPSITFQISKESRPDRTQTVSYNWKAQSWPTPKDRTVLPGLSIFAQADGSFAVWDPAKLDTILPQNLEDDAFIRISSQQIWDGVRKQHKNKEVVRCRGLIEDWLTWQRAHDESRFRVFCTALEALSPDPNHPLIPGTPMRPPDEARDVREVPTLEFPYGTVPIILCSAGIKRIAALAYLLVWAWHEHVASSELIRQEPQRSIVLLIDEMEAHLHPFWQRIIVPAIVKVVQALSEEVSTQVIIATHSPLVLASVEPLFDEDQDSLFHLYLDHEDNSVQLDNLPFVKRGRADEWLTSEVFGLTEPRSRDAEQAIERAKALQLMEHPPKEEVQGISERLKRLLAPDDEFWPLWTYFAKQQGVSLDAY